MLRTIAELEQLNSAEEVQAALPLVLPKLYSLSGELRERSYALLNGWLCHHHQAYFSDAQLHKLAGTLQKSMQVGLGENGTDSVFRRCFASLIVGELCAIDAQRHFWTPLDYQQYVAQFLAYFAAEQDTRGKVSAYKGWAHALAHASDGLMHIAYHPATSTAHLEKILELLRQKLHHIHDILVSNEDERFANAAIAVLKQARLEPCVVEDWLEQFSTVPAWLNSAEDDSWFLAYNQGTAAIAIFNNTQNFLRSLYLQITIGKRPSELKVLLPAITKALWRMDMGFLELS